MNKRKQVVLTYDPQQKIYIAEVQEVNLTDLSRESLGIYEFTSPLERTEMAKIGHPLDSVTIVGGAYLSVLLETISKHPETKLMQFASWLRQFAE